MPCVAAYSRTSCVIFIEQKCGRRWGCDKLGLRPLTRHRVLPYGVNMTEEELSKRIDDLHKRFDDLRADVNQRFAEVNQRFGELREDMNQRFGELRGDMNQRFAEVNQRFGDMNQRLNDLNHRFTDMNQKLTTFMWIVSGWFTFLTAVLAVFGFLRR